jgi:hypothetical protein
MKIEKERDMGLYEFLIVSIVILFLSGVIVWLTTLPLADEISSTRRYTFDSETKTLCYYAESSMALVLTDGTNTVGIEVRKVPDGKSLWIYDKNLLGNDYVFKGAKKSAFIANEQWSVVHKTDHFEIQWLSGNWQIVDTP